MLETFLAAKFWLKCKSIKNDMNIKTIEKLDSVLHDFYWVRKKTPLLIQINSKFKESDIQTSPKLHIHLLDTWISSFNINRVISVNIEGFTTSKKSVTCNELRQICYRYIENQYHGHYRLYTDASKDGRRSGAAFYDPQTGLVAKLKIESNISIMHSELIAISESLSYASSIECNKLVVLSDSKSALLHLARLTSNIRGHPIAYSIVDSIFKRVNQGKTIVLQWIPSHIGIVGNEEADRAARQALEEGVLCHHLPLHTELLSDVRLQCRNQWREYFDERSLCKGIWYRTIQYEPPNYPWFDNIIMKRRQIIGLLRIRSGHIPCNVYKHLMGFADSPNCRLCDKKEDLQHILMECVRGETLRQKLFVNTRNCNNNSVGLCSSILASPTSDEAKILLDIYSNFMDSM